MSEKGRVVIVERWTPLEIDPEGIGGPEELVARLRELGPTELGELLAEERALVFRGFDVTPEDLSGVLDLLLSNRCGPGAEVPGRIPGGVRCAAADRPETTVWPYNKMSAARAWPARLAMYCETAPLSGGASMVVDGAAWLAALDPGLRELFLPGVRYVRYLHDGPGLGESWRSVFGTECRDQVELLLEGAGEEWAWRADGGIQVSRVRPATVEHPATGDEVWFNQIHRWHPAGCGPRDALSQMLPDDQLPWNVTLVDGTSVSDRTVSEICGRGLAAAVDIPWNRGDLMLLDNVSLAHGRRPFTGARRIRVAMSN
ncbi:MULTISPECIES: TauD/TfdA family dioxygenase [unclassified Streptomyces]|uniref:TauD/TfdA family dioxygenase n=1 Tax=unclassified Streptomyces TaxID=2593676 RepID=UPI0024A9D7FA|nr:MULTISPECIES: TauD/TfdA family dioxygenase [unclassified Streptomyces]